MATRTRRLLDGRDSTEAFLSLTDDDVAAAAKLTAAALGEVPALERDLTADERGDNFGDARKWLGRALGWFQFAAVSLRTALANAETEDELREQLAGEEARLARILHAVVNAIRHASGPYAYLADGRGLEIARLSDALLAEVAGDSLHRLEAEQEHLEAKSTAIDFACDGVKAKIRAIAGDLVDENILEGTGKWNGSWHSDERVPELWRAWVAALSLKSDCDYRLEQLNRRIAAIRAGVHREILKILEPGKPMPISELATELGIYLNEARQFADELVVSAHLVKEPSPRAWDGKDTYERVETDA